MNLYTAAFYGQEDKVRLLLEKGADVNAQGDFSENALRAAAFEGHLEIVSYFLSKARTLTFTEASMEMLSTPPYLKGITKS